MKILLCVFKDTEYLFYRGWRLDAHLLFVSETYSNLICIMISVLNGFLIETEQKFP